MREQLLRTVPAALVASVLGYLVDGVFVAVMFACVAAGLSMLAPRARLTTELGAVSRNSREALVVRVRGPLTFLAQGKIEHLLAPIELPRRLVLDLTAARSLDAGGMTEIANVVALLAARDTRIVIAGSSSLRAVRDAEVVASVDDALDLLLGGARADDAPSLAADAAA